MIYQIYGSDTHDMTYKLMQAANIIEQIPEGGSVALKPNLVIAGYPDDGSTTHPGVLSGCIAYLQDHGITNISVIEGSWVGQHSTEQAARTAGYDKVCQKYNVPFYDLKKDKTVEVRTPIRTMEICEKAFTVDYLIDLPVLKGHCQTRMTCALKNLKGCIPDREKRRFHSEGLHRPIAALASALNPDLIIVDNICGDLDFEEGGNPVWSNRMYLGFDPVQLDAYGCQLMGIDLDEVPYIRLAEQWGAGSTEVSEEDIVCLNQPEAGINRPSPRGLVKQLTRGVHQDSACSACFANLVRALYELDRDRIRRPDHIYIGQANKGKKIDGVGIGVCCSGASICAKGCPPTVEAIKETLSRR